MLLDLVKHHPDHERKLGVGIRAFQVRPAIVEYSAACWPLQAPCGMLTTPHNVWHADNARQGARQAFCAATAGSALPGFR